MINKLMAGISALTLFLSLSLIPANAAVKAGAACKKVGITSTASGKTFTCIKSGKKLVWDIGKTVSPTIVIKSQATLGKRELGGLAISDDGSKLIVSESCTKRNAKGLCEAFGNIYTSNDYGLTWIRQENAGSRYWKGVASSSEGKILHAVSYPGDIYRSEDFGINWKKITCCDRSWWTISSSGDGEKIVAAEYISPKGTISTSVDGGKSWSDSLSAGRRNWYKVASSLDGSKIAAIDVGGFIYTSEDFGVNWKANTSVGQKTWWSIDISGDGSVIAAVAEDSNIVISNDSGISWKSVLLLKGNQWNSIAISGDGSKIFALGDYGAGLYFSVDSGKNWAKWNNQINPGNNNLVLSFDGTKMASTPYLGQLNTYTVK
jgi:photosystem II stability/assembly factor-like uncharacterized protein